MSTILPCTSSSGCPGSGRSPNSSAVIAPRRSPSDHLPRSRRVVARIIADRPAPPPPRSTFSPGPAGFGTARGATRPDSRPKSPQPNQFARSILTKMSLPAESRPGCDPSLIMGGRAHEGPRDPAPRRSRFARGRQAVETRRVLPDMPSKKGERKRVVISYSTRDREVAERFDDAFHAAGVGVWRDNRSLSPGRPSPRRSPRRSTIAITSCSWPRSTRSPRPGSARAELRGRAEEADHPLPPGRERPPEDAGKPASCWPASSTPGWSPATRSRRSPGSSP